MTFPLLSLPNLVLIEMFQGFDPVQIICLSLCSRKSTTLIKHLWNAPKNWTVAILARWQTNRWMFAANGNHYFMSAQNANCYYRPRTPCKIKHPMNGECCIDGNGNLEIFYEDRLMEFKKITTHICAFFKSNITEIELHGTSGVWIVDWIKDRQIGKLKKISSRFTNETTKAECDTLMSCDITETMLLLGGIPKDLIVSGNLPPTKTLRLDYANWLTMGHLLAMQSEIFVCWNTDLSHINVNEFIRHWLNGGYPQLKYMAIEKKNLVHEEMYQGVLERLQRVVNKRTYAVNNAGHIEYVQFGPSNQSYDIRRDDGVVASTFLYGGEFFMVVWPDALNKNAV